jgi:Thioredoxin
MKTLLALLMTALTLATEPAVAGEEPFSAATFDRLLGDGQPVVVDFHADWCPICRAQAPIVTEGGALIRGYDSRRARSAVATGDLLRHRAGVPS